MPLPPSFSSLSRAELSMIIYTRSKFHHEDQASRTSIEAKLSDGACCLIEHKTSRPASYSLECSQNSHRRCRWKMIIYTETRSMRKTSQSNEALLSASGSCEVKRKARIANVHRSFHVDAGIQFCLATTTTKNFAQS